MPKQMQAKLIYMDVCALSRPFDEQRYLRILLETDAVNMILSYVRTGCYRLAFSRVHIVELAAIHDAVERHEIYAVLNRWGVRVPAPLDETRKRTEELAKAGLRHRCS